MYNNPNMFSLRSIIQETDVTKLKNTVRFMSVIMNKFKPTSRHNDDYDISLPPMVPATRSGRRIIRPARFDC